jgi:hypothetical protein
VYFVQRLGKPSPNVTFASAGCAHETSWCRCFCNIVYFGRPLQGLYLIVPHGVGVCYPDDVASLLSGLEVFASLASVFT